MVNREEASGQYEPVSIIIALNEEVRIGNLLEDLSHQTFHGFEVIVVDSDSDGKILQVAEGYASRLAELRIFNMLKRGVARGRNNGAALARYERLLFLDADVRLDK